MVLLNEWPDPYDILGSDWVNPYDVPGGAIRRQQPPAQEPAPQQAGMLAVQQPTVQEPQIAPQRGVDYQQYQALRMDEWRQTQQIANTFNQYAMRELAIAGAQRRAVRNQVLQAMRQAAKAYGIARQELARTLAEQGQQGLSPLDMGRPASTGGM